MRDKTCGAFYLFCNEFNKLKKNKSTNLDSIHHVTLRILFNLISAVKAFLFCHYIRNVGMDVIPFLEICNLVYRIFLMALFHS